MAAAPVAQYTDDERETIIAHVLAELVQKVARARDCGIEARIERALDVSETPDDRRDRDYRARS
jgi:hypothetical protein